MPYIIALFCLPVLLVAGCARPPRRVPPPPKPPPVITLAAVGDVLPSVLPAEEKSSQVPSRFAAVQQILSGADIAFCNLESALSDRGRAADKKYVFRYPPATAAELKDAGFDVVSLANNHSVDYGREALLDTIQALRVQGLSWVGAGENLRRAREARFFIFGRGKARTRIAVLAYSNMLPLNFYASVKRAGTTPALEDLIREDVKAASRRADFTVVSFHWGDELSPTPGPREKTLARLAIDSGADVVLGGHPHVLQGMERYRRGIIAYSLGNFAFPSSRSSKATSRRRTSPHHTPAQESAIFLVRMQRPHRLQIEVVPVVIEKGAPRLARKPEAGAILQHLATLSAHLGTPLVIKGETAVLQANSPPQ